MKESMKKFCVRVLMPEDLSQIADLLKTRDGSDCEEAHIRRQIFEWIASRNPFAADKPTYFVAEDDGVIIGHLGRMPMEFAIKGKRQRGYFIHDLYVHPAYRERGLGFFITKSLYQCIEDKSKSFCCCIWTSPLNLAIQKRRKYHELWADRYVKILDPHPQVSKFIKSAPFAKLCSFMLRAFLSFADCILLRLFSPSVKVSEVKRFDGRFDYLSSRVVKKTGISPYKSSAYLNWKYIDRPFNNFVNLAFTKNGQITGVIVLGIRREAGYVVGKIVDILVDPDDTRTTSALCRASVDYFRCRKVHAIECLGDKRIMRLFRRFLFFRRVDDQPIMLANINQSDENEYLVDIDNWHLTHGDSDGFMWN